MGRSAMENYFESLERKRNADLWADVSKQMGGPVERHLVSIGPEHLAKEKDTEPEPSFEDSFDELEHNARLEYAMNDLNSHITAAFMNS